MDDWSTWGTELGSGPSPFGGSDQWDAGAALQTGSTQTEYRLPETVATDAIRSGQGMQPSAPSEWSGFFRDTLKSVIGYGIARDAIKNGVQANAGYPVQRYAGQPMQVQPPPLLSGNALLLLLIGGGLYLATRKG